MARLGNATIRRHEVLVNFSRDDCAGLVQSQRPFKDAEAET